MDDKAILDLNALVPESRRIRFGDPPKEVEVKPPTTENILKLSALGQKMQNVQAMDEAETANLVKDLQNQIYACIPELQDQPLNTAQLLKLIELITEMGTPGDIKELEKRGITPDDSKKKPIKLLRSIATFIQMYPGYKRADVMAEYAVSFFKLLNEGYKIRGEDMRLAARIAMAPEMKGQYWKEFMSELEYVGKDISDILEPDVDESTPEKARKIL